MTDYEKFLVLRVEYFRWLNLIEKEVERVCAILFVKQNKDLFTFVEYHDDLIVITWHTYEDKEEVKAEGSFHPSLLFLSEEEIKANVATTVEMQKLIESTKQLGEQWLKLKSGYRGFSGS